MNTVPEPESLFRQWLEDNGYPIALYEISIQESQAPEGVYDYLMRENPDYIDTTARPIEDRPDRLLQ